MRCTTLVLVVSILTLAACGDNYPAKEPVCGDGIVAGSEACDDGNTIDDDDCDNSCQIVGCGDGIVAFDEACDDGNQVDGDGCDTNCTETYCGNGIQSPDEACEDGNTINGDGCDNNCRPTGCGNGAVGGAEECDDGNAVNGDGCDMNCKTTACGNGIMTDGEQCDDGNATSVDGCSSTCRTETAEAEPNEDGTPETGGDGEEGGDFAIANADTNGAFTTSVTLVAALSPAGDEDVYKFTNTGTAPVRLRLDVWNLATGFGIGTACGTSIDTFMNVRNAAGDILAGNDDRDGGNDRCSTLAYPLLGGETVYVQIVEYGDDGAIASYALDAAFEAVVCGDGDVGPGEQCDDTNTATGDGCSDTCQIEGAVTEIEPNEDGMVEPDGDLTEGNDFAIANADTNGAYTSNTTIIASFMPAGDEDVFKITNTGTAPVNVALDTWDLSLGVGVSCGTGGVDTIINVRNAAGAILDDNNDRSTNDYCSTLTYPLLPGQSIYAHITDWFDDDLVPSYVLQIRFVPVVCGDSDVGAGEQCDDGNTMNGDGCDSMCQIEVVCGDNTLQPTEQCDDGNTMSGDGCDSTCHVEGGVTEVEPNEDGSPQTGGDSTEGNDFAIANADTNGAFTANTTIVASFMPAGDEDVFKVTNTGTDPMNVALDTWDLGLGIGTSCGTNNVDTVINVRNAAGTVLDSNNDRVSGSDYCSSLTYPLLPGQSIYVQVTDWFDDSTVLSYALQIQFLPVVCGDNDIGAGEQCDDGNTMNGDGCDSACQIEVVCGDHTLQPGEQCDDGNTMNGDGCSSTCQVEGATSEIEPNEDGSPSTSSSSTTGNDFATANADANPAITGTSTMVASLMPAGDEDVFKITNTGTTGVNVALDTWDLTLGIGVPCGTTGVDTIINVRDAAGTILATNNDRDVSTDYCAGGLTYPLLPGESVYAQITDWFDDSLVASYALQVRFTAVVCGDGNLGVGEQCDDGGTTPGDGCDATCQIESVCGNSVVEPGEQCDDGNTVNGDGCTATCQAVLEVEPNATTADATSSTLQVAGDATIAGSIGTVGDVDVYRVTVAAPTVIRFETFTTPSRCAAGTAMNLYLLDSTGAEITNDEDESGIASCAALVMPLAAGTYFIRVEEAGNTATIPAYLLDVAYQDDVGTEAEPNETSMMASVNLLGENESFVFGDHVMNADADVYSIVVPAGKSFRVEVVEGDRATETCEDEDVDSLLTLLDKNGNYLTDNDDAGRGYCSKLDGTGASPDDVEARNGTAVDQTFYLLVEESTLASTTGGQFVYRLQITIR